MRLRLAAGLLAGFILTGCKTLEIDAGDRAVDLYIKPYPTADFRAQVVGGEHRCTVKSSKPGILKGKPGTCLVAGADGVFKPCPK